MRVRVRRIVRRDVGPSSMRRASINTSRGIASKLRRINRGGSLPVKSQRRPTDRLIRAVVPALLFLPRHHRRICHGAGRRGGGKGRGRNTAVSVTSARARADTYVRANETDRVYRLPRAAIKSASCGFIAVPRSCNARLFNPYRNDSRFTITRISSRGGKYRSSLKSSAYLQI